jgi:hypothetical protein
MNELIEPNSHKEIMPSLGFPEPGRPARREVVSHPVERAID